LIWLTSSARIFLLLTDLPLSIAAGVIDVHASTVPRPID